MHELSRARVRIRQLEAEAAQAREAAEIYSAQTNESLVEELKGVRLDLATTSSPNVALKARADAAEQDRAAAVSAKQRAEQRAAGLSRILARERAASAAARLDLSKARLEGDAARTLLVQIAKLQDSLDRHREDKIALARELAVSREVNDKLTAELRNTENQPPLKPRRGRAANGTSSVKVVGLKGRRSEAPSLRRLILPLSLRPVQATLR